MSELKFEGLNELSDKLKTVIDKYPVKAEEELNKLGKQLKKDAISRTPNSKIEHKYKLVKSYKLSPVKYSMHGTSYITLTNTSPHFHLVEKGHYVYTNRGMNNFIKDKNAKIKKPEKTEQYIEGKHMLENANTALDSRMPAELDKWADKLLGDLEK